MKAVITTIAAYRQLKKFFGVEVSAKTIRHALFRFGLSVQVKKKKH